MHISALFLPHDCPLVTHIVNSYMKNYLKEKKSLKLLSAGKKASTCA